MTGPTFSVFKTIKNASPSSPADIRRTFKLLRAGRVDVLIRERMAKISGADGLKTKDGT